MTTLDGGTLRLIGATLTILARAIVAVVWLGRQIRGTLGPGAARRPSLAGFDAIPPALVKQALERGLLTSAQLAAMTPIERQFVLESVKRQMENDANSVIDFELPKPGAPAPRTVPMAPITRADAPSTPSATPPARPVAPAAPRSATAAARPSGALPASDVDAIPDKPRLKVWCPLCGEALKLPAFPPMVAYCPQCGAKTAVRDDSGAGRYIINVAAPQGSEPPRAQ